ncbi:YggS family pyridoxal phosphate-dependent enzyme [Limnobacter sp.]|uniref:YggS family pyridoxal phosphate-dependent enzyme n=1 Tax=Limnobacter sp. TaxID=2003368 RepID=UPI00258BA5BB|nr:YggS family pyridoxal phosphate-dependent enzyme [Limnobacter sp.]
MMSSAQRLSDIQLRIRKACEMANRPVESVSLLAVSKTFPAEAVLDLARLGQTAFGENYLQEAEDKITQLADTPECPTLTWHFIGPVQSNKTKSIASMFAWVHSVDRLKIAQRLSSQRPAELAPLNILLQVNTSGEASKSGLNPAEVEEVASTVAKLPNLNLRGLMTIPNPDHGEEDLQREFLMCKSLMDKLNQTGLHLDTLSMGMSQDLETAIACGSTCVRVGTALFGKRDYSNR